MSLRVMAGSVRIAGKQVAMEGLKAALSELKQSGVEALIVVPTEAATVQDLVTVLEGIKAAGIESATVLDRKGPEMPIIPAPPPRRKPDFTLTMINIVFLLLLFFLTTGSLTNRNEAQADIPFTKTCR